MGAKRLCLFLLTIASELFTWIRGSIEKCLMDSEKTVQFPLVDVFHRKQKSAHKIISMPLVKPECLNGLKRLYLTLEFEVDSKKQSLLPNPSAAKHSFCCSLWMVAVHCRTTSSSCKREKKRKTVKFSMTQPKSDLKDCYFSAF